MKRTVFRFICAILAVLAAVVTSCFSHVAAFLPPDDVNIFHIEIIRDAAVVMRYIGSGGDVTVPATHDGYPVTQIAGEAFKDVDTLTSVTIPDCVKYIGSSAFNSCYSLTSVKLPRYLKEICSDTFWYCTSLEYVSIPDGLKIIGSSAFKGCRKLSAIMIPDSVTSIGGSAFSGCEALTAITVPDSVKSIGRSAFSMCSSLKKITVGRGVMTIGESAFSGCSSLTDIYFKGTREKWKSFGEIRIPDGAVVHFENQSSFSDVPDDAYYAEPVKWAIGKGITSGTSAVTFSPNDGCTRGQTVTFLWRLAGSPDTDGYYRFSDVSLQDYFYRPVLWATDKKITTGTGPNSFSPEMICTRGQIVTFLWRAAGSPRAIAAGDFFSDVCPDDYYYTAVVWATQKGITKGTASTTFAPDEPCSRAQVVTFLYRNAGN